MKPNRILNLHVASLDFIADNVELIRDQGFDSIQTAPLQTTKNEDSGEWWMLYQPIGFNIGNRIGNEDSLRRLCDRAHSVGLQVYVDVVINHLAGADDGSLMPNLKDDKDLVYQEGAWKERSPITDWNDRNQVITKSIGGLPSLNQSNYLVKEKIFRMMDRMVELGVDGFRLDAAKSIALPNESCDFFSILRDRYPNKFIYGEVLNYPQYFIDKYAEYMHVLTDSNGSSNDRLVKFAETHDTYLSDPPSKGGMGYTKEMPVQDIKRKYLDLCSRYLNTLFYARNYNDDWHEWKSREVKDANYRLKM